MADRHTYIHCPSKRKYTMPERRVPRSGPVAFCPESVWLKPSGPPGASLAQKGKTAD